MATTWHPGERAVQRRAGVEDRAAALLGALQPAIPPVAREFLAAQPWIVIGAADANERMWASVLYGPPGFVSARGDSIVHIAARPLAGDPLERGLDGPVGGLALEPGTRRRMRLNGLARSAPDGLLIELEQVYANCPKYIATRDPELVGSTSRPVRHVGSALDARAAALLSAADTAFVATRAPGAGADASHRGGNPGFLHVLDAHTVAWPDYQGNSMFNTLGNLEVDPACGLTVVDPTDGTTLYVSGRATIVWDGERFPGAKRLVELRVDATVRLDRAAPLRWRLERPARNPPV